MTTWEERGETGTIALLEKKLRRGVRAWSVKTEGSRRPGGGGAMDGGASDSTKCLFSAIKAQKRRSVAQNRSFGKGPCRAASKGIVGGDGIPSLFLLLESLVRTMEQRTESMSAFRKRAGRETHASEHD